MLRRLNRNVIARANLSAFHVTRGVLNNKGHSSEDQAEMERERALREKFAQKIGGFAGFANRSAGASTSSSSTGSTPASMPVIPKQGNFFRIFFFITAIYMLVLIAQLENPNSAISIFQGMRWWQVPTDTVAYLSLMRVVLPFREQTRLKTEFEDAQKLDPNLTLPMFFNTRYPTIFQGNRASQQQIVAAIAACLASTRDIGIVTQMSRSAGMARDTRVAIDSIMETLCKEHPHVFAPQ